MRLTRFLGFTALAFSISWQTAQADTRKVSVITWSNNATARPFAGPADVIVYLDPYRYTDATVTFSSAPKLVDLTQLFSTPTTFPISTVALPSRGSIAALTSKSVALSRGTSDPVYGKLNSAVESTKSLVKDFRSNYDDDKIILSAVDKIAGRTIADIDAALTSSVEPDKVIVSAYNTAVSRATCLASLVSLKYHPAVDTVPVVPAYFDPAAPGTTPPNCDPIRTPLPPNRTLVFHYFDDTTVLAGTEVINNLADIVRRCRDRIRSEDCPVPQETAANVPLSDAQRQQYTNLLSDLASLDLSSFLSTGSNGMAFAAKYKTVTSDLAVLGKTKLDDFAIDAHNGGCPSGINGETQTIHLKASNALNDKDTIDRDVAVVTCYPRVILSGGFGGTNLQTVSFSVKQTSTPTPGSSPPVFANTYRLVKSSSGDRPLAVSLAHFCLSGRPQDGGQIYLSLGAGITAGPTDGVVIAGLTYGRSRSVFLTFGAAFGAQTINTSGNSPGQRVDAGYTVSTGSQLKGGLTLLLTFGKP
jgi:hypothetical protein